MAAARARHDPGWRHFEIDVSHSPRVTTPQALMAVLEKVIAERAIKNGEGSGVLRRTPHSQRDAFSLKTLLVKSISRPVSRVL